MTHTHLWTRYRWRRRGPLRCPCCERSGGRHTARQRWMHPRPIHFSSECPWSHKKNWRCCTAACHVKKNWSVWCLLPPHFWTLPSISSHSSLGVEVVQGLRSVVLLQAHEHPEEQAHCSHHEDHQTCNQGLPNHFPVRGNQDEIL